MQSSQTTLISALSSLILALAVVMSGAHAKELASLTNDHGHFDVKQPHDEGRSKVGPDLHTHIDKTSFKSLVKGDSLQVDARSLRLTRDTRRAATPLSLGPVFVWMAKVGRFFSLF